MEVVNTNKTIDQKVLLSVVDMDPDLHPPLPIRIRHLIRSDKKICKRFANLYIKWSNSLLITYMLREQECSKSLAAARVMYTNIQTLPIRNTYTGMTILQT